jgi:hypothetical protein
MHPWSGIRKVHILFIIWQSDNRRFDNAYDGAYLIDHIKLMISRYQQVYANTVVYIK